MIFSDEDSNDSLKLGKRRERERIIEIIDNMPSLEKNVKKLKDAIYEKSEIIK